MINNTAIDLDVNEFEYEFEYMMAFLIWQRQGASGGWMAACSGTEPQGIERGDNATGVVACLLNNVNAMSSFDGIGVAGAGEDQQRATDFNAIATLQQLGLNPLLVDCGAVAAAEID